MKNVLACNLNFTYNYVLISNQTSTNPPVLRWTINSIQISQSYRQMMICLFSSARIQQHDKRIYRYGYVPYMLRCFFSFSIPKKCRGENKLRHAIVYIIISNPPCSNPSDIQDNNAKIRLLICLKQRK